MNVYGICVVCSRQDFRTGPFFVMHASFVLICGAHWSVLFLIYCGKDVGPFLRCIVCIGDALFVQTVVAKSGCVLSQY